MTAHNARKGSPVDRRPRKALDRRRRAAAGALEVLPVPARPGPGFYLIPDGAACVRLTSRSFVGRQGRYRVSWALDRSGADPTDHGNARRFRWARALGLAGARRDVWGRDGVREALEALDAYGFLGTE